MAIERIYYRTAEYSSGDKISKRFYKKIYELLKNNKRYKIDAKVVNQNGNQIGKVSMDIDMSTPEWNGIDFLLDDPISESEFKVKGVVQDIIIGSALINDQSDACYEYIKQIVV